MLSDLIALALWMIYFTIIGNPKVSLIGFATALSGLVFYYFSPKKKTFSSVKKEDEPTEERNFDRL